MNTKFFPPVQVWNLTEGALAGSLREMAEDGVHGNEGVVLWLGRCTQEQAGITHLVGLRGPGVVKQPDVLMIASWLLNEVTDLALDLNVRLVGQMHSHGKGYSTDLSVTDRTHGIMVPYYLSIVAPDYGLRSVTHITDCGVHVFEPGLGYRRLSTAEIRRRVEVLPGPPPPLVLVGQE